MQRTNKKIKTNKIKIKTVYKINQNNNFYLSRMYIHLHVYINIGIVIEYIQGRMPSLVRAVKEC
jgi:hypothetical protein